MNTFYPALIGAALCCGAPLLSFVLGMLYARRGAPFVLRWQWGASKEESSSDD